MKRIVTVALMALMTWAATAQPRFDLPHGLYDEASLTVGITPQGADSEIRYTTDGSEPTAQSTLYTEPLLLTSTTLLRAVEVKNGSVVSPVTTTAVADYEMDPEMTGDSELRPKIIEGLWQLPILSLVSDKENFFSRVNDEEKGGIYIYTGPPVGDATGHGWTRPASIELFGGPQRHDLTIDCGMRLHGGHGRLAEKNPKHSFRLVFKDEYGPDKLEYPLFGEDEPQVFKQLVLRCHFGNSWQHWMEGNRQEAQYTRDVWARRMQRKMGHTSVNALYVHLFLNGMYWGLYNIAERVDGQFGKDHLGGKKSDIDVIKIEEDGGNHIEAAEGTLDAWEEMLETAADAADAQSYAKLDTLLDIDAFIDYMLINQYAGNTDWDHHNWYALRRRGQDSQGFRFLCWDTEIIFENVDENLSAGSKHKGAPTTIFQGLLKNNDFAARYRARAKELLADDGLLGETSVVEVWDSLYNTISTAIYDESARWGDYRRDVHQYAYGAGKLYTVDKYYMRERNRLLTEYFPYRSKKVLTQILAYVLEPTAIGATLKDNVQYSMFNVQYSKDKWYTLQGIEVKQPTKGIYIRNGKKVFVK